MVSRDHDNRNTGILNRTEALGELFMILPLSIERDIPGQHKSGRLFLKNGVRECIHQKIAVLTRLSVVICNHLPESRPVIVHRPTHIVEIGDDHDCRRNILLRVLVFCLRII